MSKPQPGKKDLRIFELIWALIFLTIGLFPAFSPLDLDSLTLEKLWQSSRHWALYVSAFFVLTALIFPALLKPFYIVWVKLGELIGAVISKIILCVLFYCVFTPIGLFFRLIRKDLLHRKLDAKTQSYWLVRKAQPGSMKNQF